VGIVPVDAADASFTIPSRKVVWFRPAAMTMALPGEFHRIVTLRRLRSQQVRGVGKPLNIAPARS
jgi:hypothetical protein